MLYCEQCGCSGKLGTGWVTFVRAELDEIDEIDDARLSGEYCPPCAAAFFGYQSDAAAEYVCAWEPIPSETAEGR